MKIEGNSISIKGPKGSLDLRFDSNMKVELDKDEMKVSPKKNSKQSSAIWGLTRVLIANMVEGVTKGFEKSLELHGVGYRMALQGKNLNMALGFSHPVEVAIPEGLEAKIEKNTLTISGIDKQKVGQLTASIRALKKVEPYKGKGFRYVDEIVKKKAGKKAVSAEK